MPTQTLGDVIASVYSRLDNNDQLYDRASIVDEINDALQILNILTGVVQTSIQVFTGQVDLPNNVLPQLIYPVPDPIMYPVSIDYEGRNLEPMSLDALASQYRSWATDVSYPGGRPVKEWASIGFDKFVLHPMDGQGGRSLIITGVIELDPLVNDNDKLPLPNEYANDLENLVGSVLPIREGGRIFEAAAAELYSAFIQQMKIKAAFTNLKWSQYYERLKGWRPYVPSQARITQ